MSINADWYPNRLVFWEPQSSPHKSELFAALSELAPQFNIVCCAAKGLAPDRQRLGWEVRNQGFEVIEQPSDSEIRALVNDAAYRTLHIFSGFRWLAMLELAMQEVLAQKAHFGIMSEPRASEGWRGLLRFLHSLASESKIRQQVSFVLGIGRHGPKWFYRTAYKREQIFPFAYFVDPPTCNTATFSRQSDVLKVCFCGRMVEDKGLSDLVDAIKRLRFPVHLTLVGDGPIRKGILTSLEKDGVSYDYLGAISRSQIGSILGQQDVLVLPSRTTDDGWGVVVSEALMCGAAVVVSTAAGSSILTEEANCGVQFKASSVLELAKAIEKLRNSPLVSDLNRSVRRDWAIQRISSKAGASYLVAIIDHVFAHASRPHSFWQQQNH